MMSRFRHAVFLSDDSNNVPRHTINYNFMLPINIVCFGKFPPGRYATAKLAPIFAVVYIWAKLPTHSDQSERADKSAISLFLRGSHYESIILYDVPSPVKYC